MRPQQLDLLMPPPAKVVAFFLFPFLGGYMEKVYFCSGEYKMKKIFGYDEFKYYTD